MATATEKATSRTCSSCTENPAVNGQAYCRACRAAYQQQYRDKEVAAAFASGRMAGWKEGATAMRADIVEAMTQANPNGMLKTFEVAQFISGFRLPPFQLLAGQAAAPEVSTDSRPVAGPSSDQRATETSPL